MTAPELEEGQILLEDHDEKLWRHVAGGFHQDGSFSFRVFVPTSRDDAQLSVSRASILTAHASFEQRLQMRPNTVGTTSLTVGEVEGCSLRSFDDSAIPGRSHGHALVDFRPRSTEECLDRAKDLHRCALARGWEHGPILPG